MKPIHIGNDRDSIPMVQWVLDAFLMELLHIKYKGWIFQICYKGGRIIRLICLSWLEQEHFVKPNIVDVTMSTCTMSNFLEFNAAGKKQVKGNKKSESKIPKRHKQNDGFEILFLVDAFIMDTPNRN
jgi:hypothetical protein